MNVLLPRATGMVLDKTRSADAVWGLAHIPKTAGSSLVDSLVAHRAPYYNIVVKNYATSDAGFREQEWEAVREFADIQKLAPAHSGGDIRGCTRRGSVENGSHGKRR